MIGCRTLYALNYEHTVTWSLAEIAVVQGAPKSLYLHWVNAWHVFVLVNAFDMIVLVATSESASDYILGVIEIGYTRQRYHIWLTACWVQWLSLRLTVRGDEAIRIVSSFKVLYIEVVLDNFMIYFLSISFVTTNDNTISVVWWKRPNQCFCLSDTTTCCLGFSLFGENQYMTLLLATEAFSDTLHTVPALPMLH